MGLPGRVAEMVNRSSMLQLFIVLGLRLVCKDCGVLSRERCGVRALVWCLDGAKGGSPTGCHQVRPLPRERARGEDLLKRRQRKVAKMSVFLNRAL